MQTNILRKDSCLSPYRRDVYLAYLIEGSRRTQSDGFPIIEPWMVAKVPPKELVQWDQRRSAKDPSGTGLSFYSEDSTFNGVLSHPIRYTDYLRRYGCIVGVDSSPYDNMPLAVQKSQIYLGLAITYYYGRKGLKIIPNVRLGDMRTLSALEAFPKHTLIAIGTNGFIKAKDNHHIFSEEVKRVVSTLDPLGIIVYGSAPDWLFQSALAAQIPLYQYDSFMMRRYRHERQN